MSSHYFFQMTVLLLLIFETSFNMTITVGGAGPVRAATPEVQAICDRIRGDFENKVDTVFPEFQAVLYQTQVVAGLNYFVKVQVGTDEYVHLRIYQDFSQRLFLSGFQMPKTAADPLEPFSS
jgi:cystatin-A/B